MTETKQTPPEPTADDLAKGQEVAKAGAEAAAAKPEGQDATQDVKDAMRTKADEVGLQMSDADIDQIAEAFTSKVVSAFEQRGAFDNPVERVQAPPAAPQAPPPPGEQPEGATGPPVTQGEPSPAPPRKRTFADRFLGN